MEDQSLHDPDPAFDRALLGALAPADQALQARSPEAAFAALESRLVAEVPQRHSRVGKVRGVSARSRIPQLIGGIAATLCLALGSWFYLDQKASGTQRDANPREYATAPGQRATITLRDGTIVRLNAGTRIRLSDTFDHGHRDLELDGEAEFTVVHDPRRPFTVHANGAIIRDLATVFAIRAYRDAGPTHVAVREGKVSVQSRALTQNGAVPVDAGYIASIAQDGVPSVNRMGADSDAFAWTTGQLVLRQTRLGEALIELSRWYGMEFRAGDSALLSHAISSRFPVQFSIEKMHDIADVLGARVVVHDRVVTFVTQP